MKLAYFMIPLLLTGSPLLSREIATEEPVVITGKLSVSNSLVYITRFRDVAMASSCITSLSNALWLRQMRSSLPVGRRCVMRS